MKSDQYLLGRHRAEEDRLARQSLEYEGEALVTSAMQLADGRARRIQGET